MPDIAPTPEELQWSARLAARLKFVQADFSDLPPEERQPYLDGEIHRALKDVVAEKRPRYLAALQREFPTFAVAQAGPQSEPADNSPEALVEALVRIAPQLKTQQLTAFGLQLQQAGYLGLKSTTLDDAPPEEFARLFQLPDGASVDLQRLYRLTLVMTSFYLRLEVFAWKVWQEVAPQSRVRKDIGPLHDPVKLGARYLTGDAEVSAEQIKALVEKTRQLTAGLLGAIGGAGRSFANKFAADFSPDAIAKLARMDTNVGGGMFGNEEVRAWRKFKNLFQGQTEEVVEEKLHQAIATSAEGLMRGLTRER